MQRAARPLGLALGVEHLRLRPGVRGDGADRVERWALLVVGGDARQVLVHELARGDAAGSQCCLQLRDYGLHDLERTRLCGDDPALRQFLKRKCEAATDDEKQQDRSPPYPAPHAIHPVAILDRKSTRLNSSHSQISYAVFCLKKKTIITYRKHTT